MRPVDTGLASQSPLRAAWDDSFVCSLALVFSGDFHGKLQVLILGLVESAAEELAKGCMILLLEKQTWSYRAQRRR